MANELHYYLYSEFTDDEDYVEMVDDLKDLTSEDKVFFHINCVGGIVSSAYCMMNAIHNTKATTIAVADGDVYSAATLVFFKCDKFIINPYTQFMFHSTYFDSMSGTMTDVINKLQHHLDFDNDLAVALFSPYLNETDLSLLGKGADVWYSGKDMADKIKAAEANRAFALPKRLIKCP